MYENWYHKFLPGFDDSLALYHQSFTVKADRSLRLTQTGCLSDHEIFDWLQQDQNNYLVRAIFTTNRKATSETEEVHPSYMSLNKSTFAIVSKAFRIPTPYLYLRANANASGAHTKYHQRNELGEVTHLAIVIRVPHAPQNELKSIWSISLSWDLERNSTDIFCDGFTPADLQEVEAYISLADTAFRHPFALLVFFSELLDVYYNRMIQVLGVDISILEKNLGITRGNKGFHGWNWKPEVFRAYTQECYRLTASPVYLERRMVFLSSLCNFILDCLYALEQEAVHDFPGKKMVLATNVALIEVLKNNLQLINGQLHQVRCLETRLQNLMSTLNTIVAQVDSRSNLDIAAAAKHDSSSMLTIAFLTVLFLPPTYVSSVFGMNFFDFESDETHRTVSPLFWLYWAVTIPLTAAVFVTWRLWEAWRKRNISAALESEPMNGGI